MKHDNKGKLENKTNLSLSPSAKKTKEVLQYTDKWKVDKSEKKNRKAKWAGRKYPVR